MRYYEFIHSFVSFLTSKSNDPDIKFKYIEFGIREGSTFNRIAPLVDAAYAVDIDDRWGAIKNNKNAQWYNMNTDAFISQLSDEVFDLVFIDADHSYRQSMKDFNGILPFVREGGFILLHDSYPASDENTHPSQCGEVYKTAWEIRMKYRKQCEIVTLPSDSGISIVRKASRQLIWKYSDIGMQGIRC
jgi:hypothetical protein